MKRSVHVNFAKKAINRAKSPVPGRWCSNWTEHVPCWFGSFSSEAFLNAVHIFLNFFLNVNIWAHLLQAHPSPIYSSAIPFTPRAIRRLKWQLAASPRSHFERTHPTAPNKRLIQQSYSGVGGWGSVWSHDRRGRGTQRQWILHNTSCRVLWCLCKPFSVE